MRCSWPVITTLMMALLEGTDRLAERRMLLRLDMFGFGRMVVELYHEACPRAEKTEPDSPKLGAAGKAIKNKMLSTLDIRQDSDSEQARISIA
jgi:hypothetical protein